MKAVRIQVLAVYTVVFMIGPSAFGQQDEAERWLADGDRLAWLKNWQAGEPLFEKAEMLFRERGDERNELYARISRMRGQLPSRGLFETEEDHEHLLWRSGEECSLREMAARAGRTEKAVERPTGTRSQTVPIEVER
jgi:hypothetical protein